ncbi:MAG: DUF1501 domain-containing protein [Planctomycetes bacterium]|nr:DUF1501 domain-containing protein [Planctomycetota bacterium]
MKGVNTNQLWSHSRRAFLRDSTMGLGSMALASLLNEGYAQTSPRSRGGLAGESNPLRPRPGHFPAKAKAVIFLFMAGGPSHLELFDPKPTLQRLDGQTVPASFTQGRRFAFIRPDAKLLGTRRRFFKAGQSGADFSELLPFHRDIADDICILKGMKTDVFNHGPAKVFLNTGSPQFGRPSMGSWITYGLGSESNSLPAFVVLQSGPRGPRGGAAIWSSGFLPTLYSGTPFLRGPQPILDLQSPPGVNPQQQGAFIDAVRDLNRLRLRETNDPEIETRINAYETAFRMQTAAPEVMNLTGETAETLRLYGVEQGRASFGANCLLTRRLVERGVRYIQLIHTDWDHHGGPLNLETSIDGIAREVDRPSAALVKDLKRRGMLDDTLVIWGGEFGRTPMGEPRESLGRDHHIDGYTMWLAGGGIKPGHTHGRTDEIGYNAVEGATHVHDLQATILHQMGLEHTRLTYRFQGRDFRLTDVHGHVVREILA